jgi:hypothetical protein
MLRILYPILVVALWITMVSTETHSLKRVPNFRTSKRVTFLTQGGGISHHLWVFQIMEELYKRGHNVSFYSTVMYYTSIFISLDFICMH